MDKHFTAVLLMASMVCTGSANAQATAAEERLDELMVKSGLWKQLAQVEPMIQAGVAEAQATRKQLNEAEFARLKKAFANAYAADKLRADVRKQLSAALPEADQKRALVWLSSELGVRITRLEEQSGEVEESQKRETRGEAFFATLAKSRADRMSRLIKAMRLSEALAALIINTNLAMAKGFSLTAPASLPDGLEAMTKQLQSKRSELIPAIEKKMVVDLAYIYQPLSDAEIDRYIKFAVSAAGRKYHQVSIQALEKAMVGASQALGIDLGARKSGNERQS